MANSLSGSLIGNPIANLPFNKDIGKSQLNLSTVFQSNGQINIEATAKSLAQIRLSNPAHAEALAMQVSQDLKPMGPMAQANFEKLYHEASIDAYANLDFLKQSTNETQNTSAVSTAKEITLDPKSFGITKEQFAEAIGKNHSPEIRKAVAEKWANGENLPRFQVADIGTSNAMFDPSAGENGTITLNARLVEAGAYKEGFGALATWGVLEEVGHWADRQSHIMAGNPNGQTKGDEGGSFASATHGNLIKQDSGFQSELTLGTVNGEKFSITYDTVVLKGIGKTLGSNGYMDQEHKIGNIETYHPDGHYAGTFLTAIGAGHSLGISANKLRPIALEMALGSQLPDMIGHFDALTQASNKAAQTAKGTGSDAVSTVTFGKVKIETDRWTSAEQQHLQNVYKGLHGMPATEREATRAYLTTQRSDTSKYISERIAAKDYLAAGVAIHRLGDLYAHVRPDGRPYWGDLGHGLEDAKGRVKNDAGRSPDMLFYEPNFKRFRNEYIPTLSNAIAIGFKNGRMAQNNENLGFAAEVSKEVFDRAVAKAKLKVIKEKDYHYDNLVNAEKNFFITFRSQFGEGHIEFEKAEVKGKYPVNQDQFNRTNTVMNELKN
jgi:hypothetical protein